MTQPQTHETIESRRAFMKKLGKLASVAAVAASFVTMTAQDAAAKGPDEDNPGTCDMDCGFKCNRGSQYN